jgi:UDP-glucose:(heptosyl)LPS alpha-1,3-glucosyltransferase
MRVALICQQFNARGGVSRDAFMFAGALRDLGVELDCYCDPALSVPIDGLTVHAVPAPHIGGPERASVPLAHAIFAYRASRAIARARSDYDVVYVIGSDGWEHDAVRVHSVVRAENRRWPLRGGRHFRAARVRARLAPMTRPQNAVERAIQRRQFSARRRCRPVAVTDEVKSDLVDEYSLRDDDIDVLPTPIDVRALRSGPTAKLHRRFALADDARVVLFVGNDFYRKGLDDAIRVVALLPDDVHLVVVGAGTQQRYRQLATNEGVHERVHFAGHVDRPEAFYGDADVLLFPTREDVWGTTLVEAMAAGLAIVATWGAGASRAVADGRAGIIVDEPTTRALAEATTALLDDPDRRRLLGERGMAAAESYDVTLLAPRLKEILERVARGG